MSGHFLPVSGLHHTQMVQFTVAVMILILSLSSLPAQTPRSHYLAAFPSDQALQAQTIATSRSGFVWIAGKDRLIRFDGTHYHPWPSPPFLSVLFVAVAPDESVWVGGSQGVARWRDHAWTLLSSAPVTDWQPDSLGIWLTAPHLHRLTWQGAIIPYPAFTPSSRMTAVRDTIWFLQRNQLCSISPSQTRCEPLPVPGAWTKAFRDPAGKLWLASADEIVSPAYGRSRTSALDASAPAGIDPFVSPQGKPWVARSLPPSPVSWGVSPFSEACTAFSNETTRWVCLGQELLGKLSFLPSWTTWNERNIVSPQRFIPQLSGPPQLATVRGIYQLNPVSRLWQLSVGSAPLDIRAAEPTADSRLLLATTEKGLVEADRHGRLLRQFHPCSSIDTYRFIRRDSQGRLWIGGKDKDCFFLADLSPGAVHFTPQQLPGGTLQTVVFAERTPGEPCVGYDSGIACLGSTGRWQALATSAPIEKVRDFVFRGPDEIWLTHRRPGFFTHLVRNRNLWHAERFHFDQFPPHDTHSIHLDSRGWLWRLTNQDVWIARPPDLGQYQWLRLHEFNGLSITPMQIGGFHEEPDGRVWLMGEKGVVSFLPDPSWFTATSRQVPTISRIESPSATWLEPATLPTVFPGDSASLSIDFATLHASPLWPYPIRYRFAGQSDWVYSPTARLVLPQPPSADYKLEFSYTGPGNPPVATYSFRVGSPLLFSRWLPAAAGTGLLVLLFAWLRRDFLSYRMRKLLFSLSHRPDTQSSDSRNLSGQLLNGRYRVGDPISSGGFSRVYRATDSLDPSRTLALKIMSRPPADDQSLRRRYSQEVAALAAIRHPGVVPLLDSWILPTGEPCLLMPYLEGRSLRDCFLSSAPFPPHIVAAWAIQLSDALDAIHKQGIVHRDLKPENILLSNGNLIIIDFGISAIRGPLGEVSETATLAGSIHYLSPERLSGQYSPASDVYALGALLIEALTGRKMAEFSAAPFEPAFLEELAGYIPLPAAQLLQQSVLHNPQRRPTDLTAWAAQLAALLPVGPPTT